MKQFTFFLTLVLGVSAAHASRLYDSFEGGRLNCRHEDSSGEREKEIYFSADMTLPFADKQVKFKPNKIFLMTASYQKSGWLMFGSREFVEADELTIYAKVDDHVIICGQTVSGKGCSFNGGDDSGTSPEMTYFIDCPTGTKNQSVAFRMTMNERGELDILCETENKAIFSTKIQACNRTEMNGKK